MGLCSTLVVALFSICGGSEACAEHQIGHAHGCGRPDVILIRGGLGYWPGADAMADEFRCAGYAPTVIHGWEHVAIAKKIVCASRQGRLAGGIVIVGYSSGADAACLLARRLERCGIRVETMVLIESTLGTPVPGNVDYCVNYYASRALDAIPMFRGVPVECECPDTILFNIDLKCSPNFANHFKQNHFVIGSTCTIRKMTLDVVLSRQNAIEMLPVPALVGSLPDLPSPR
jgi:hypothetical protein